MIGRCKDCKYWSEKVKFNERHRLISEGTPDRPIGTEFDRVSWHEPSAFRNTELIHVEQVNTGFGFCNHPKMDRYDDIPPDGACLDPGYDGDIYFGGDFGCVHFTPKA